jgi:hypothetical protein
MDNPLLRALRARSGDFARYNFSTFTGRMETETGLAPNLNAVWKIPSVNGYSSFVPTRRGGEPSFYRANWGYPFSEAAIQALSIKYILLGPETPSLPYAARLHEIARYKEYTLVEYETPRPKYFFLGKQNCIRGFRLAPGKGSEFNIEVRNLCPDPQTFAFPLQNYPWWKTFLDEREVRKTNFDSGHDGVQIPPGEHRLAFRCVAQSWYWGIFLSLLSALGMSYLLFHLFFTRSGSHQSIAEKEESTPADCGNNAGILPPFEPQPNGVL